ncbi:MAG: hypothetical protein A2583_11435 [Bdellovibrionales bacterium RIFOXYD1_FULL_53_11]|nr:MAG: hypothetical protein A2583_11435 [Bdellovibrionales bacterium RIFOXYD1_FULL_53_11]
MNTNSKYGASALSVAIAAFTTLALSACDVDTQPVKFNINIPGDNTLAFNAEVTERLNLGLSSQINFAPYGSLYLNGETPDHGFQFGFSLYTSVFMKESWINYEKVNTLPTGALFPSFIKTQVVDVEIPEMNTKEVAWHLYFGTDEQFSVGVAALIARMNEKIPEINLGYTFYDKQGHVIIGIQIFAAKKNSDGSLAVPGGIYVGTDITPFLPADFQPVQMSQPVTTMAMNGGGLGALMAKAMDAAINDKPLEVNGESIVGDIKLTGKDKKKIKTKKDVRKLLKSYTSNLQ